MKQNLDVFTWAHSDMKGIDPSVMSHRLNIDPSKKPVRQKRRAIDAERYQSLNDKVDKLLSFVISLKKLLPFVAGKPCFSQEANGKWRTCVDFTDLNKACPKDSFLLPRVDQLMDATSRHALLSFMDAYSGYNQTPMHVPDQEYTSFI